MNEIPVPADETVPLDEIAPGVFGLRLAFVNVFAIRGDAGWTLVDAGLYGTADRIRRWAHRHFGEDPPTSILLTHAHFDHVGALDELADGWNAPVYAHWEELDYVTGARSYPPPDPSVGGGLMARMAGLYPRRPKETTRFVSDLQAGGAIRDLSGWRWIHTPGHTAGHVSLFRDEDRTLIVGDAFCTTDQESFFAALVTQKPQIQGPPAYFTTDWDAARDSVRQLASLQPRVIAPGHGQPMSGDETAAALQELAARFDQVGRPDHGRYVDHPTRG